MNQRQLGQSGLPVSEIGLGARHFGGAVDHEAAFALLDEYERLGGSFVQAGGVAPGAPFDACWASPSESYIAEWMESRRVSREAWTLSTQVELTELAAEESAGLASRCEQSLRRLRSDYIDLLVCRWRPGVRAFDRLLADADLLARSGKVRSFALVGVPPTRLAAWLHTGLSELPPENVLHGFQGDYSLLARGAREREWVGLCRTHALGFLATAPLGNGVLARSDAGSARSRADRWPWGRGGVSQPDAESLPGWGTVSARVRATAAATRQVASSQNVSPASVALAWVLLNPSVTAAITGPRTVEELRHAVAATEIELAFTDIHRLDAVSASPGSVWPMNIGASVSSPTGASALTGLPGRG